MLTLVLLSGYLGMSVAYSYAYEFTPDFLLGLVVDNRARGRNLSDGFFFLTD